MTMTPKTPEEAQGWIARILKAAQAYSKECGGTYSDLRPLLLDLKAEISWLLLAPGSNQLSLDALTAPGGRPPTDVYFMNIAQVVATRATCDRKHVGAVIVRERRIIATGYNGSPPGLPHCDDVGHDLVITNGKENCVRTVHAEMNAVAQAALYGVSIKDADIYTNTYPCWNCAKALLSGGVKTVYVDKDYNNDARVEEAFKGRIRRVG